MQAGDTPADRAPEFNFNEEHYKQEEKRLVRKVDWILMPILTITLGLQVSLMLKSICCRERG